MLIKFVLLVVFFVAACIVKGIYKRKEEEHHLLFNVSLDEKRLEIRGKANMQALISSASSGSHAEYLVKLERLRTQERMAPEKVVALALEVSPVLAHHLGQKYIEHGLITTTMYESIRGK